MHRLTAPTQHDRCIEGDGVLHCAAILDAARCDNARHILAVIRCLHLHALLIPHVCFLSEKPLLCSALTRNAEENPLTQEHPLSLGEAHTFSAPCVMVHDTLTYASFTLVHSASVTCTDTSSGLLKSVDAFASMANRGLPRHPL